MYVNHGAQHISLQIMVFVCRCDKLHFLLVLSVVLITVQVKHGVASQVFQACSAAKRHNLQVALYLLPHVVVQVLLDGTEKDHLEVSCVGSDDVYGSL